MSRIIQVPIDDSLLQALDALSDEHHQSRAAVIREACRQYVAAARDRRLDELYKSGYARQPESPAIGVAQASVAAHVLDEEEW